MAQQTIDTPQYVAVGKFLSYILRHNPPESMDQNGWVPVDELIQMINDRRKFPRYFTREDLEELVETNNKKRYSYNEDHTMLRANQGHSISVDVELQQQEPPDVLYHGTGHQFLNSILEQGIQKRSRQHVHLSADYGTAINVGSRHGKPIVLVIQAKAMHEAGIPFFLSANGVWLTDEVPTRYFRVFK